MERKTQTNIGNTKTKKNKRKQTKNCQGIRGDRFKGRTTLDKHSEFGFFPIPFPCREGGIWAPSEGASILKKSTKSLKHLENGTKNGGNKKQRVNKHEKREGSGPHGDYGKNGATNQMPSAPSNQIGKTLKSEHHGLPIPFFTTLFPLHV